jgi:hypothetical protein
MPIRFQYQRHQGQALQCPAVFCDACGKQITDSSDGIVDYTMQAHADLALSDAPCFFHRGACTPKRSVESSWDTLGRFLDALANNTGHQPGSSTPRPF